MAELIRRITSRIKSQEDRQQAENVLRQLDTATVLELVFPEIERLEADPDAAAGQFANYLSPDEKVSDARLALLALQRLWSHCLDNDSHNHGTLLLALLKTGSTDASRRRVLYGLQHHYVPEAEAPLAAILRDSSAVGWSESAAVLLQHRPETFGPVLIDYLENKKESLGIRMTVFGGIGLKSFDRMDERNRKRFICSGFALIEANRRAHPTYQGAGYFPAVWVRTYLKDPFPELNPADLRYRTADGNNLNAAFFEDTAVSALAWWRIHRKEYE